MKNITTDQFQEPPKIDVESFSTGTLRTSASWIGLMLQAEDPDTRRDIIVDLIDAFGMDYADLQKRTLTKDKICRKCACGMYFHDESGACPE